MKKKNKHAQYLNKLSWEVRKKKMANGEIKMTFSEMGKLGAKKRWGKKNEA